MRFRHNHTTKRGRVAPGGAGKLHRSRPRVEGLETRQLLAAPLGFNAFSIPDGIGGTAGITTGPDNNIWFTEPINNKIGRITTTGILSEYPLTSSGSIPERIADGPEGALWFTEQGTDTIGRITTDGAITEFPIPKAAKASLEPLGIALGPDKSLWFTESLGNAIGRITAVPTPGPNGTTIPAGTITQFTLPVANEFPQEITLGPDGNMWFTTNADKIDKITTQDVTSAGGAVVPAGTITEFPTLSAGAGADSIVAGPAGDNGLYFVEFFAGKLGHIDATTGVVTETTIPAGAPAGMPPGIPLAHGVTLGSDGAIWFTELSTDLIGRYSTQPAPGPGGTIIPAGTITEYTPRVGTPPPTTGPATSQFSQPFKITNGPDGNLYFSQSASNYIGEVVLVPSTSTTINITGVPVVATEGESAPVTVATFDQGSSTTPAFAYTATIDWGDGTKASAGTVTALPADPLNPTAPKRFSVTGSHLYPEESGSSAFPVTVTISDTLANTSNQGSTTATVADAPLTASVSNFAAANGVSFTGQVGSFTDADVNGTTSDYTATINWGDTTSSTGLIRPSSANLPGVAPTFLVIGTHTYATSGPETVSLSISDAGGAVSPLPDPKVTVQVVDPTVIPVNVNVPVTGFAGSPYSGFVASFLDINQMAQVSDFTASLTYNGQTIAGTVVVDPTALGRFNIKPATPLTLVLGAGNSIGVTVTAGTSPNPEFFVTPTVIPAPLTATIAPSLKAQGKVFSGTVATFTDANPFDVATDNFFTATINWGDNTASQGSIEADGHGGFIVVASHTYATEGALTLSAVIGNKSGASTTVVGTVSIPDYPLSIAGIPFSTQQASPFGGTIATFKDADPNPSIADYSARVVWGDGTVAPATILPDPTVAGQFDVVAGNTYAFPGSYTVGVVVTDRGGASPAIAVYTANVTAIPTYALVGTLDAASDSGPSNTDHVTNVSLPTFVGTAGPNAIVQIYGQNYNSPTGSLFGQGTADALGNWRITVFSPLPDGAYSLVASANDGQGHVSSVPTRLMGGAPLFIVTTSPKITNALYDSKTNQAFVNIQTTGAPLDLATLTNAANYSFSLTNSARATPLSIQAIGLSGTPSNVGVTIRLNVRRHPNGILMTLKGSAIEDLAGNLLDGNFVGSFPTSSNLPGSDFRGQFFTGGSGLSQAVTAYPPVSTQGAAAHEAFLNNHKTRRTR